MNNLNAIAKLSIASVSSVLIALGIAKSAQALDFDFSGAFQNDNDVLSFDFTVGSDSTITIFSSSWDDGGFDPILAIWDSNGNLIEEQDDGGLIGSELSNSVSYDYDVWDSYYTKFLTAGNYTATVAQYNNFAVGSSLSDGFRYDGAGNENFTAQFGCTNGKFCGVDNANDNRTNEWAFHILDVDDAVIVDPPEKTPEPTTMLGLLAFGALGASTLKRKEKQQAEV